MNLAPVASRARNLLSLGIKARTIWLIALASFTAGWLTCCAWMLVIHYAPQVAISLIAKVGML